jgi:hypothetical protein
MKRDIWLWTTVCMVSMCRFAIGVESAAPQPILRLAPANGSYAEDFRGPQTLGGDQLPTPARGLVGLHLGYGAGPFKLEAVEVRIPTAAADKSYCVKIASSDARYWSLNPYQRTDDTKTSNKIESHSRFLNLLAQTYLSSDVVIRVLATNTCNEDAAGALVPAVLPGTVNAVPLIAYINAPGDRANARLLDFDGNSVGSGTCRMVDDSMIYTELCELPLNPQNRQRVKKLAIEIVGAANRHLNFDLQLAP